MRGRTQYRQRGRTDKYVVKMARINFQFFVVKIHVIQRRNSPGFFFFAYRLNSSAIRRLPSSERRPRPGTVRRWPEVGTGGCRHISDGRRLAGGRDRWRSHQSVRMSAECRVGPGPKISPPGQAGGDRGESLMPAIHHLAHVFICISRGRYAFSTQ